MLSMKKQLVLVGLLAGAVLAPTGRASGEDFKPPEGKVAIHYYRADGAYDGWGVHVWESFQKKEEAGDEFAAKESPDSPVMGASWFKPVQQSGKDDFGVYFLLDAKAFGNGRVNYMIHMGDKKDQGGKDMFWLVKDGNEIFVNAGDKKIYMSKEEAVKARK